MNEDGAALVVAGTDGGERRPPTPDGTAGWHLPPHVRDPRLVRSRGAAQVSAGADVLLAHTFLTHRRALASLGEARRAREWTELAVSVAREAAEQGLEQRLRAEQGLEHGLRAEQAGTPGTAPRDATGSGGGQQQLPDPSMELEESDEWEASAGLGGLPPQAEAVLVAGVMPPIGETADRATGRLRPSGAAAAADLRAHAGLLADAGVDLILVERSTSVVEAASAAAAAAETGLPFWIATPLSAVGPRGQSSLDAWIDVILPLGPRAVLLSTDGSFGAADLKSGNGSGGVLDAALTRLKQFAGARRGLDLRLDVQRPDFDDWINARLGDGVDILAVTDAASPEAVRVLRSAADRQLADRAASRRAAEHGWRLWLNAAAQMAPGGPALWLGPDAPTSLPAGFAWTYAPSEAVRQLPAGRYQLIVQPPDGRAPSGARWRPTAGDLAHLLERGGVLVASVDMDQPLNDERLHIVDLRSWGSELWLVSRRVPG